MNQALSGKKLFIVGFTLFSMFFGAGNLIFPPYLAAQSGSLVWPATAGFLISAVGLPVLGVVAVARSGGLDRLAGRVHPGFALIFTILIYLSIGPCLAIPRTASTSFEMAVLPFFGSGSTALAQLLYSAVFFAIAVALALYPDKLTRWLGRILCPILLILIVVVFAGIALHPEVLLSQPAGHYQSLAPVQGFLDGYQTMDTIAALNFGIVIAMNIRALGVKDEGSVVKTTVRSGVIAGTVLTLIYLALAYIGAYAGAGAQSFDNGARVLTFAVEQVYGKTGSVLLGMIFFIACLNTCTGLLSCCSEYFSLLLPRISYRIWMAVFAVASFAISNAGLDRILAFSVPVLNAIYPIAIVLIALSFICRGDGRFRRVYPAAILFTAVISIVYALDQTKLVIPGLTRAASLIPGYRQGLGWLIPAAAGGLIGCCFGGTIKKSQ